MIKHILILLSLIIIYSCQTIEASNAEFIKSPILENVVSILVLGTIQDAGSPHIACKKACCKDLFDNPDKNRKVVSLGIVDNITGEKYLFEATPDISTQLKSLVRDDIQNSNEHVNGIFLTHAHIGHYAGLMYLGKEATNAKNVPVYSMPRMKSYLETNGPWSQLVTNNNIALIEMEDEKTIELTSNVSVTPFVVPHRDEFSETVGYRITGPNKSALFIPDIDKWGKWDKDIIEEIKKVDVAFLDATFYSGEELNNRDITQIPHPFIIESLERFRELSTKDKAKINFIHFNHTNPVINLESKEAENVLESGFNIAQINEVHEL